MSFRDAILNNAWQKIISFSLAVLLWFAIDSTTPENQTDFGLPTFTALRPLERGDYRRPITVMNSAANTRAFEVVPNQVDVVVRGDPNKIKNLEPSSIRVFVDVSSVTTNSTVPVEVSPPANVTFEQVSPTHVSVTPLTVNTNADASANEQL